MQAGTSRARHFTPVQRRATLAAVMIAFLLSALDQTVVSTAMPRIVAELNGLRLYGWVTTGYLVASTVMIPIWGRLSDLYGRRPVLLAGVSIFIAGSALCGLAWGMLPLILFRGLQGLGGGALFTSAFAVISDLYPARERGKLSGLFGAVFGLASVLGPMLGGVLSDYGAVTVLGVHVSGWRWVFYVNLPFALVGLGLLAFVTPQLNERVRGRIDAPGVALLAGGLLPLLLGLSLGGQGGGWTSPLVAGLIVAGMAGLGGFLAVEARSCDPLVSLELFRDRVFLFTNATGLLTSMAFIGVVTFLPLYLQLGEGLTPTASGAALTPLVFCLILSAALSGLVATSIGRYKAMLVAGAILMTLGAAGLWRISPQSPAWSVSLRVGLLGLGLGPMQSLLSLAVQNAAPPSKIGIATGGSQFFREAGATFGVGLLGAVLSNALAAASHGTTLERLQTLAVAAQAGRRGPALDMAARLALTHAVQDVMAAAAVMSALAIAAAALTPSLKLKAGVGGFA